MKKLSSKEKIILLISFFALLGGSLFIIYSENVFQNVVEIKYPDGCIEKYINRELVTDNCTIGRQMAEIGKKEWPKMNFTLQNTT